MLFQKRYCVEYEDRSVQCFRDDGFWYTDKGIIIKWIVFGVLFGLFMLWFVGGYIHAKRRLKKGLPLLSYHRFLISYSERKRHGQVPQNHFTFYAQEQPYYPQGQPYQQRPGNGPYAEPPPLYNNNDAPPQYFAPPGASKMNPNQNQAGQGMEMPMYGAPQGAMHASGPQESGVVRGQGDVEQGQVQELPPRPQQAKEKLKGIVGRFRR